jgi:hypothetical protein
VAVSVQAGRAKVFWARHRHVALAALRALGSTVALLVLYYRLPLDRVKDVPWTLAAGVVTLAAVTVLHLRLVSRAPHPALRAIEALATTLPLFLLLFASSYFIMAGANPANFNTRPLDRTSALYFTVTVFTTVGFGDIAAVSQSARLVVTAQMLLDLLVLGLVVRAFLQAVQAGRQRTAPDAGQKQDEATR